MWPNSSKFIQTWGLLDKWMHWKSKRHSCDWWLLMIDYARVCIDWPSRSRSHSQGCPPGVQLHPISPSPFRPKIHIRRFCCRFPHSFPWSVLKKWTHPRKKSQATSTARPSGVRPSLSTSERAWPGAFFSTKRGSKNINQHGDMLPWVANLDLLKALLPQQKQSKTYVSPIPHFWCMPLGKSWKVKKTATQQSHEKGGGQGR